MPSNIQMLVLGFKLIDSAPTKDQHRRAKEQVEKLAGRMSIREIDIAKALYTAGRN